MTWRTNVTFFPWCLVFPFSYSHYRLSGEWYGWAARIRVKSTHSTSFFRCFFAPKSPQIPWLVLNTFIRQSISFLDLKIIFTEYGCEYPVSNFILNYFTWFLCVSWILEKERKLYYWFHFSNSLFTRQFLCFLRRKLIKFGVFFQCF